MYRDAMPRLMKEAGYLVVSEEFSEMEDPDPDKHRERQLELYGEIEEAKKMVAQEEAEALKAGKKVKKKVRKSGFLGLWGKEIEAKPTEFDASHRKVSNVEKNTMASSDYIPYEEMRQPDKKTNGSKKPGNDSEYVLFDVDKMREELAANGITMKNLESTLPPLKVPSPPPASPAIRASTTPSITPIQRATTPSLPVTSTNVKSTLAAKSEWVPEVKDITPKRPLEKLIVDTKRSQSTPPLNVPHQENAWDDHSQGAITMSFMPESPQALRAAQFERTESEPSKLSHTFSQPVESKRISGVSSLPFERNVWEDDDFDDSGGNIVMHFE